jgi:hypothetical protein
MSLKASQTFTRGSPHFLYDMGIRDVNSVVIAVPSMRRFRETQVAVGPGISLAAIREREIALDIPNERSDGHFDDSTEMLRNS